MDDSTPAARVDAAGSSTVDENLDAVRRLIDLAVQHAYAAFYDDTRTVGPDEPDDVPDPVDGMAAARFMVAAMFDALEDYNVRVGSAPRVPIGPTLRRTVFERDRYRCRRCGAWVDLQVDHVIPHSKGGPAIEENLQALCRPCNAWKQAAL